MSTPATEQKAPKAKAKTEPKPSKPTLTATAKKHLAELTAEIERIEGLKSERLAIMHKEHERGVAIAAIAEVTNYSVARARQLLAKGTS